MEPADWCARAYVLARDEEVGLVKMACRASSLRPLLFLAFAAALQGFPFRPSLDLDVTPRITVFSNGKTTVAFTLTFTTVVLYLLLSS